MKHTELIYARHNRGILAPKIDPSHIGFCELTVVFDGTLEYTVDGTVLRLTAGDMLYIPKGSFRSRSVSKEAADYISFNFTSEEVIDLPMKMEKAIGNDILLLIAAKCQKLSCCIIGFRMNTGIIHNLLTLRHTQEAGTLLKCLRSQFRNLLQLTA